MYNNKIIEHLQKFGVDIKQDQLKSHNNRVLVSKSFTFDAAHHLHAYQGKCATLHGHTYEVIFGISGYTNEIGLVIDFSEIKKIWKDQIEIDLDHQYLNESLPAMNTTAENLVVWIYQKMEQALTKAGQRDLQLEFVRLFETPTSYAEARREWM
ncbi:6-carboxytetrahydropterin synthase QueD [Amphibacillus jilinensis]|uniref:6-carboxytetrahydropterin synthase QueD n=1 Tax=Amphibacillus jilinensis TaxID=1216008 RepID=UPI0002DC9E25|nr:6-carboxytetrahydropterin synthase QueD [Amphibacillus jilinensis]